MKCISDFKPIRTFITNNEVEDLGSSTL